jgi:bla regulator protein BlaR1
MSLDLRNSDIRSINRTVLLAAVAVALVTLGMIAPPSHAPTVAVPMAFGSVRMVPMHGQILHPSESLPSFEVATIRPWKPMPRPLALSSDGTTVRPKMPLKVDPLSGGERGQRTDRVHFIGQTVLLIASAYNLPLGRENQILGAPEWVEQEANRYEIQAKIEDSLYAAMQKMTPVQQREQVALMEQSLLADRFKLKVHFETREMPVYALVVAKGGAKLTPAKDSEVSMLSNTREDEQGTETTGKAVTLEQLAHSVLLFGGRRVVDQTGLKGTYDFTLMWGREQPVASDVGQWDGTDAPLLFTAIQEQLGLKLVLTKGPAEVIVIDHIERPSEN